MNVAALRQRPAWALLETHCQKMKSRHLRGLFAEDPERGTRLTVEAAGVYLDYAPVQLLGGIGESIPWAFRTGQTPRLLIGYLPTSG